jgi:S-adenosylmethionine-diacylgycerolhomoserine-N-methlytransferase
LEHRVALGCADAAAFDSQRLFGRPHFDRAFFSYSLSMVPAWQQALLHANEVVAAAGGRLLIVDFGQQERLPAWFRRMLFDWLARFHVTPRTELETALRKLANEHGGSARFDRLYRGYAYSAAIAHEPG